MFAKVCTVIIMLRLQEEQVWPIGETLWWIFSGPHALQRDPAARPCSQDFCHISQESNSEM